MTDTVDNLIDLKLLTDILNNLVTTPNDLKIDREIDEMGVLLSVVVNPQDMGIVIGRNGGMALAIKTLMRAIGKANNLNVRVQFLEPDGSTRFNKNFNENSEFQHNFSNFQKPDEYALN